MTNLSFSTLTLSVELQQAIVSLGFESMMPIQAQALPFILDSKDVIAQAKTGSGKTAAFGIGILSKLQSEQRTIQSIVLCPTRELAQQVTEDLRRLAHLMPNVRILTLCGGKGFKVQAASLEKGAHIVVGTPGRVLDHLVRKTIDLKQINTLVLDEADRMLDMGFEEDLASIIKELPKKRQTLLFSATYPDSIKKMSGWILSNPVEVRIDSIHTEDTIEQLFYQSEDHERDSTLICLLRHYKPKSTLVFCNTKLKCNQIETLLKKKGFYALAMHGDLEQVERNKILIQFANKSCPILVATDVAARGLDIDSIEAVINYELSHSAETHMHRIGRTGRAGKSGLSLSIFKASDANKIKAIEALQGAPLICAKPDSLQIDKNYTCERVMRTLCISGGKKQKLRAGDIVGSLTGTLGFSPEHLGKITISDYHSYVAVESRLAKRAFEYLQTGKIKSRTFKVQLLD